MLIKFVVICNKVKAAVEALIFDNELLGKVGYRITLIFLTQFLHQLAFFRNQTDAAHL